MRYLVDTHLLLWSKATPARLGTKATAILTDPDNQLSFSVVSIWEIVIKAALGRTDFQIEPSNFRRGLLDTEYTEIGVVAAHVLAVGNLRREHGDPFDRLLVAQAKAEGLCLLTSDSMLGQYGAGVEVV